MGKKRNSNMGDTLYEQYIKLTEENGTLKKEVVEMQKQVHTLQIRVKELNEELYHSQRKNK